MRIFPKCGGPKTSESHLISLTTKLNVQRKNENEEYCDITLVCGGTQFSAHKVILAAASPYFECLLGSQFAESKQNEIDLSESIGNAETLDKVLEFIYTGSLLIDGDNYRDLLSACTLFLLTGATDLISEYLKNSLVIANCLEIFELAYKYSLEDISKICLGMIRSRMHDYFCHGAKLLPVPPEIFIHLYEENVFNHRQENDTKVAVREYIVNLKAGGSEISQNTITKLYQIAKDADTEDICSLFEGWSISDQQQVQKIVKGSKKVGTTQNKTEEILLIKCKSKNDWTLLGWLNTTQKWIDLGSVDIESVGPFVGFACNSMVFEADFEDDIGYRRPSDSEDIVLIPLYDRAPKEIKTGCAFCLSFDQDDEDDDDEADCPHIYFTAWNELYCLSPKVQVRLAEHDKSDSEGYDFDYNERFLIGYEIKKYSANDSKWNKACDLNVPREYYYYQKSSLQKNKPVEVCELEFQVVHKEAHLLLAMVDYKRGFPSHPGGLGYYLSVMQLTPDPTSGKLTSEAILKKQVVKEAAQLFSKTVMTASSINLRFQEISEEKGRITELNMKSGAIRELKADDHMLHFPEHEMDDVRLDFVDRKFVTSRKNGFLYHIDNVLPYINVMWSFDPLRNKWKSLPGPPRDEKVLGADLQIVPTQLLDDIRAYPATIFEDTRCNGDYGPFSDWYEESISEGDEDEVEYDEDEEEDDF